MNQRYTDSVGVRLILIFFATVLLVRVHGQNEASSICAAEGSWKTNMCAKETDFYGNVTCRERLIVLSEEGEEIDVLATMVELKSELTIVRSQNTELRNRLSHVESTVMPSPPPPSPPPNHPPPPSPPPAPPPSPSPSPPPSSPPAPLIIEPIPDASFQTFVHECLGEAEVTGECETWASGNSYGTMPNWNTSLVTKAWAAFSNRRKFNGDITNWDTSQMTNMGTMLQHTYAFNQDIGNWDTSKATSMYAMFMGARVFNQDIGDWNTEKVTNMGVMFRMAYDFNHDIGSWNTAQVITMASMFNSASAFNHDIGSWNTAQVTYMTYMFHGASAFNQDIGNWNTAQVTYMGYMFYKASAFNQDISSWTGTASTTAQTNMFDGASAFQAKFTCTNAVTGPAASCVPK